MQPVATFSIVAYNPGRKEWGVAVQSKFLAAAAIVSWARANAGAVATQSFANLAYGPDGLEMMANGMPADEVVKQLISNDEDFQSRQLGVVDKEGRAAAFTGEGCQEWAGHLVGDGYACQGNILIPGTVEAMAGKFEAMRLGEGELADWLVAALAAGQAAGGDSRGRQAAGVLVVREDGGYGGKTDRYLDLRVDDHPEPIEKLGKLLQMHHLFFGETRPEDLIPLSDLAAGLQKMVMRTGDYSGPLNGEFDEATRAALYNLVGRENLEERWDGKGDLIDMQVVKYLSDKFPS